MRFQSTLPARGATTYFLRFTHYDSSISIHAPRTGSDCAAWCRAGGLPYFNPRSPHGERHVRVAGNEQVIAISIHAPRTGSDADAGAQTGKTGDFNPRSPHGERPELLSAGITIVVFQSTLPARGATRVGIKPGRCGQISIHAPRTGSDPGERGETAADAYFNPRSPHGERRCRRSP